MFFWFSVYTCLTIVITALKNFFYKFRDYGAIIALRREMAFIILLLMILFRRRKLLRLQIFVCNMVRVT